MDHRRGRTGWLCCCTNESHSRATRAFGSHEAVPVGVGADVFAGWISAFITSKVANPKAFLIVLSEGHRAQASLYARGAVLSLAIPGGSVVAKGGEVLAAVRTIEGAEAAGSFLNEASSDLPQALYRYTRNATATLIEETHLGLPGRVLHLTPEGNLAALQARIELALPSENTPTAVLKVSKEGLDASRFFLKRRVTGNVLNRAGGGFEYLFDGSISLGNVTRIR